MKQTSIMKKSIVAMACLFVFVGQAGAQQDNQLYIKPFEVKANKTVDVDVMMDNTTAFDGHSFQFRLYVPDGLRMVDGENGYRLSDRLSGGTGSDAWQFMVQVETGTDSRGFYYLFKCVDVYNSAANKFRGIQQKSGPLMTITLAATDQMPEGQLDVAIRDQVISNSKGNSGWRPTAFEAEATGFIHLPGDATDDCKVNVTDIMAVANWILSIQMTTFNQIDADVNGDGVINVTDIMGIANIILGITPEPQNSRATQENDEVEPQ